MDSVNVRLTTAAESAIVAGMVSINGLEMTPEQHMAFRVATLSVNPPPLLLKNGPRAAVWLQEHLDHHPGIKVTAKSSRCLGCGSRLREPLQVEPLR